MREVQTRERRVLDVLRERYEDKGFSFFKYPSGNLLPVFLGNYMPDAIALGPTENIVIEVKSSPPVPGEFPAAQIVELFRDQTRWKFELVLADDVNPEETKISRPEKDAILKELAQAKQLAAAGHHRAAFTLAWGALEAAARTFEETPESRPKTPGSLVEFLEGEGLVSYETARELRSVANVRNRIVHGDLSRDVEPETVSFLMDCVQALVSG